MRGGSSKLRLRERLKFVLAYLAAATSVPLSALLSGCGGACLACPLGGICLLLLPLALLLSLASSVGRKVKELARTLRES